MNHNAPGARGGQRAEAARRLRHGRGEWMQRRMVRAGRRSEEHSAKTARFVAGRVRDRVLRLHGRPRATTAGETRGRELDCAAEQLGVARGVREVMRVGHRGKNAWRSSFALGFAG